MSRLDTTTPRVSCVSPLFPAAGAAPGSATGLQIVYHPLVDMDSGDVAGFSAEPVWSDPDLEMLFPARLHAESCACAFGAQPGCGVFLDEVVAAYADWLESGAAPERIMVGLDPWSGRSGEADGKCSVKSVGRILDRLGVEPARLVLFFDVDRLLARPAEALDLGLLVKRLGVGLGVKNIDILGPPLHFLEMFPADFLKIRLSHATHHSNEEDVAEGLSSFLSFGDNLLMHVAVEGVDSLRQYRLIRERGCRYALGGYFSRPLAPEGAMEFYRSVVISPRP